MACIPSHTDVRLCEATTRCGCQRLSTQDRHRLAVSCSVLSNYETEDSDVLECCTLAMQLQEMYIRLKGIVAANTLTIIIPKQETPSAGHCLEP